MSEPSDAGTIGDKMTTTSGAPDTTSALLAENAAPSTWREPLISTGLFTNGIADDARTIAST